MSEIKTEELAALIRKAGKVERVGEFQYPYLPDVYFRICYASKFMLQQIREVSREAFTNLRTRTQEERFNEEKLRNEYAKLIIKGWRGLTVDKLNVMLPGMVAVEGKALPDQEVPFGLDIAVALMDNSFEFENWVVAIASEVQNFSHVAERKKEQLENLK